MATSTNVASAVHLISGRINLGLIWQTSRQELEGLLGQKDTKKVIVWDEALIGPVGLIAEVQFLRTCGVYKMVRLPIPNLTEQYLDANEYFFFTRPKLHLIEQIIEAIRTSSKKHAKRFVVVFVPQKSRPCILRFEEYGLTHNMKVPMGFYIEEYHLDMLPLDHDVISLDINSAFTDLYLDQDPTPLYQAAKAICKLQALYGIIPKIIGKGKNAKMVAELMERMRQELFSSGSSMKDILPQFDSVILLDRSLDLLTPLSTQLTYEGLIDEVYGIKHCCAKFPRQMFSEEVQQITKGAPPPTGPITLLLNSEENMYVEMRDLNFRAVGQFLSREAKKITAAFEERHGAKTVSQLKQFVQKLPHMQQAKLSLGRHTTVAELVKTVTDQRYFLEQIYSEHSIREEDYSDKAFEYIESCIGMAQPVAKVLKLICMQSAANSGLKPKLLDHYKKEILQCYGYQHLLSLHNLEKAGLLRVQETKTFPLLRKTLRLTVDKVNEIAPKDTAYVFSGYAPLSVRLVEQLEKPNGWATFEEVANMLPGPTFKKAQPVPRGQEKRKRPSGDRPRVVLVFFLGGCSYAEISALRFLSQREEAVTDYIIGTTHITNGMSLMNSILAETPRFRPTGLWDNQMDEPAPPPPQPTASIGPSKGLRPRR